METMTGLMGGLNRILDWFTKLVFLNILWVGGIVLGLGVFGFFPATIALFAVVRKWVMHELDTPIFKTFIQSYKKEFLKGNLLGMIIVGCSLVLYIDYHFIQMSTHSIVPLFTLPLGIVILLFICTLFYVLPMFVHFDMKMKELWRNAFFMMLMNPFLTLMMLITTAGLLILYTFSPPLMLIFSGNLLALSIMWPAYRAFQKVTLKKGEQETIAEIGS